VKDGILATVAAATRLWREETQRGHRPQPHLLTGDTSSGQKTDAETAEKLTNTWPGASGDSAFSAISC
jgi:hypothetical protein